MNIRAELVFRQRNNVSQLEFLGIQIDDGGIRPKSCNLNCQQNPIGGRVLRTHSDEPIPQPHYPSQRCQRSRLLFARSHVAVVWSGRGVPGDQSTGRRQGSLRVRPLNRQGQT